jgi:hypothetical protein
MDSEDYIELPPIPPSDSEEGYDGDGDSILEKVNKEDSKGGEGDDKNDLHEDSNQYERKNNPYTEDVGKDGSKYNHDIFKIAIKVLKLKRKINKMQQNMYLCL